MDRRAFVTLVGSGALGMVSGAAAQGGPPPGAGPRWGPQAEKEFKLGRGMGPKLMSEDEWKEHHRKMQTLTGEERERYRKETHDKMRERAKEKGIAMPAEPGPYGKGKGAPPPR